MIQPLPVDGFDWVKNLSKIDEDFIKNNDEDSDKEYILEVDVEYRKNLHDLHSDLRFLPERVKANKCKKFVCNLYSKNNYVIHIRSLKQALKHGLILKKVHRVIQLNQEAWLKPYIDMTDKRKNQLVPEPNYHTTKWFSENPPVLAIEMKKTKVKMNKPVYLGFSILAISKTLMCEFWDDYMKPKYGDNVKLCYMANDSFIMHIKTEDFYKDIADGVEKRLDNKIMKSIDHYRQERIKK